MNDDWRVYWESRFFVFVFVQLHVPGCTVPLVVVTVLTGVLLVASTAELNYYTVVHHVQL